MAKVRYVSFLAASLIVGCRSGQDVERCQMRLDSLRSSITDYRFHKGIYPASGGRALLAAMAERSELGAQFFVFPKEAVNSSGEPLDEWGSPLVYINRIGDKRGNGALVMDRDPDAIILYSVGRNHIDEQGSGDDIRAKLP